jgi:predicted DNA binding CopG/RHH family protein
MTNTEINMQVEFTKDGGKWQKRKKKQIGPRMEEELVDHIKEEAARVGVSENEYVKMLVVKDAKAKGKSLQYDYWH